MRWLLSTLGVSPYAILAVIAAGAGLFFFGRYEGGSAQREADKAALADAQAKQIVQMKAADQITFQVSTGVETKLAEIHQTTLNLIFKVPNVVSQDDDARCVIPTRLVGLFNEAASGVPGVPDATGKPNVSPQPAPDPTGGRSP